LKAQCLASGVLALVVLLESLMLVAETADVEVVPEMLLVVVAVVTVTVTGFLSGCDKDSEASTSSKPTNANDAFMEAAVLATFFTICSVV
jgi:hypothetical protein